MPERQISIVPFRLRLVAAFAAVYLIWGSTYLSIRFAIQTLPPLLMASTRFIVAGVLLYAWSRLCGEARPTRANWGAALVVGGALLLAGNGGVSWAEQLVPSGLAALLVATVPLWMVLFDWVWLRNTRPTGGVALGLVLGLVGIVVLAGPGSFAGGSHINLVGVLVLLVASLCWALGSLYANRAPVASSPLLATAMEMLAGGALLLVVGTASGEWGAFHPEAISIRSLLALGYLIVFGSLVAFTAYIWLLRVAAPAHVSTYAYVNPVVALFLGWALAGEQITARMLIAAAVIVAAVVLITTYRARRATVFDERQTADIEPAHGVVTPALEAEDGASPIECKPCAGE